MFFVGGVSLLTLVVNGLTAGPLLRYLGLNKGSGSEEGEGEEQTAAIENEVSEMNGVLTTVGV